ncbi:hypothetical protein F4680DRAFT_441408 [Xylaria scruposa]|nr:hypothetical protein F4680DRAFT_441408 [Xylaria scruposa]
MTGRPEVPLASPPVPVNPKFLKERYQEYARPCQRCIPSMTKDINAFCAHNHSSSSTKCTECISKGCKCEPIIGCDQEIDAFLAARDAARKAIADGNKDAAYIERNALRLGTELRILVQNRPRDAAPGAIANVDEDAADIELLIRNRARDAARGAIANVDEDAADIELLIRNRARDTARRAIANGDEDAADMGLLIRNRARDAARGAIANGDKDAADIKLLVQNRARNIGVVASIGASIKSGWVIIVTILHALAAIIMVVVVVAIICEG